MRERERERERERSLTTQSRRNKGIEEGCQPLHEPQAVDIEQVVHLSCRVSRESERGTGMGRNRERERERET